VNLTPIERIATFVAAIITIAGAVAAASIWGPGFPSPFGSGGKGPEATQNPGRDESPTGGFLTGSFSATAHLAHDGASLEVVRIDFAPEGTTVALVGRIEYAQRPDGQLTSCDIGHDAAQKARLVNQTGKEYEPKNVAGIFDSECPGLGPDGGPGLLVFPALDVGTTSIALQWPEMGTSPVDISR